MAPACMAHYFGILSISLHPVHDATEGLPGGPGSVFTAGNLPGLVDDEARAMAEACGELVEHRPENWDGIHTVTAK